MNKVEREFAKVKDEVQKKLQEAAKALQEASQLCRTKTGKSLADLQYDGLLVTGKDDEDCDEQLTDDLMVALRAGGWQTSSLSC